MRTRVLLVDDEKDYLYSLSRQLTVRDFDVLCATSGDQAIATMHENEFDVIILDVLMPGKDGIETFKEIKRIDPEARVIMHTGHARIDLAVDELKAGIHDYIIKPVAIDELVEKINMAVAERNISRERNK